MDPSSTPKFIFSSAQDRTQNMHTTYSRQGTANFPYQGQQTPQDSQLSHSSMSDVDQNIPFDIKALFDPQRVQPETNRPFSRLPSFYPEASSAFFEEPTYSNYPAGNLPKGIPSANMGASSPWEGNYAGQGEVRVGEVNFETVCRDILGFNKICPYCSTFVGQEAFEQGNVLAMASSMQRKQYLMHRDCHLTGAEDANIPRILPFSSIFQPKINPYQIPASPFNKKEYYTYEKRGCFVSIEGYHPISSYLYFKVDKICSVQQHISSSNECLFLDFTTKTTNIFEPSSYTVPFDEFRVVLTIHMPDDEPFRFEFLLDVSALPLLNNGSTYADVFYNFQNNNILLSCQVFQQGLMSQHSRNLQVLLRTLNINLPLKRLYQPNGSQQRRQENFIKTPIQPTNTNSPPKFKPQEGNNFGGENFYTNLYSPGQKSNVPEINVFKPSFNNPGMNVMQGNNNNNTQPKPGNNNDFGSYFKFQPNQGLRSRVGATLPPPFIPSNKKVSFEEEGLDDFDAIRPEESPIIFAMPPGNMPTSPIKSNSPPTLAPPIERKESGLSDHSIGKGSGGAGSGGAGGRFLSRLSTLGSDNEDRNVNNGGYNIPSMHESELDKDEELNKKDINDTFRLEEQLDNLEELAKSCQGSKVLQQFILSASQQEIEMIIMKIGDQLEELMLDPYANYMVKTLMQSCAPEQRYLLLQKIAPSMVKIACHKKGTHTLQVIVNMMSKESEYKLVREAFKDCIVELSIDSYATHVIQKLIITIPASDIAFIFDPLVRRFAHVARHSSGILVIKHLIKKVENVPELKKKIISVILDIFEELIQDQYGNYTIQYALEHYPDDCDDILEKILVRVISYSSQKYTSNVIEKCVTVAPTQFLKRVINEIMKLDRLSDLMKNKYGNYVLLHVLISCDLEDKERIMQGISKNANLFHGTKYKQRWSKFIEDNPLNIYWSGAKIIDVPHLITRTHTGGSVDNAFTPPISRTATGNNRSLLMDNDPPAISRTHTGRSADFETPIISITNTGKSTDVETPIISRTVTANKSIFFDTRSIFMDNDPPAISRTTTNNRSLLIDNDPPAITRSATGKSNKSNESSEIPFISRSNTGNSRSVIDRSLLDDKPPAKLREANLERVKKVWREMNKNEKKGDQDGDEILMNDQSGYFPRSNSGGFQHKKKGAGGWNNKAKKNNNIAKGKWAGSNNNWNDY